MSIGTPPQTTRSKFTWGSIRKLHRVGEHYLIVEYNDRRPDNEPHRSRWRPAVKFHPYVRVPDQGTGEIRWDDSHHSYSSLDEALVACVAYRYLWTNESPGAAINEDATHYFMKMVNKCPH